MKLSRSILSVIAFTTLVVGAFTLPFWLPSCTRTRTPKPDAKNGLKQLGIYLSLYESKFNRCPTSLDDLQREMHLDPSVIACPRCGHRWSFIGSPGSYTATGSSTYTWGPGGITDAAPPDLPLAMCLNCRSHGDEVDVLFFQGRVDVFAIGSPTERGVVDVFQKSNDGSNPPADPAK